MIMIIFSLEKRIKQNIIRSHGLLHFQQLALIQNSTPEVSSNFNGFRRFKETRKSNQTKISSGKTHKPQAAPD